MLEPFTKFICQNSYNFDILENLTKFENIANGRRGAILVDKIDDKIPIIRTTTIYKNPAQKFSQKHYDIIKDIRISDIDQNLKFNNAMIEIYDNEYRNMKYHSDQSLDLEDNSYICLYTCYDKVRPEWTRTLKIKEKNTGLLSEILLEQNSFVLFSKETNSKYLHKIVLENRNSDNKWLGLTFRLSKTFIKFILDIPYIYNTSKILTIANSDEKDEFLKHRRLENKHIDHIYPEINYTLSISDIISDISDTYS